jgi:high-affinity iron transporter
MIVAPTIIAFREGLEAALVIAILLSYVRRTGRSGLRRAVLGGAAVAIAASVVVSLIMGLVWGIFEGTALAVFEGIVVLVAAFLLTTMILWMWRAGARISTKIEERAEESVTGTRGLGLAMLSIALVLREGVELALFNMALVIQEGYQVYLGTALGLLIATAIGVAIYKGSLGVSLGALFKWTSLFLVLFAAGMVAYGIHELQEAGLLLIGPAEIWNLNPPQLPDGSYPLLHERGAIGALLKALFGYNGNPSALEVVGYVAYLVLIAAYYFAAVRRKSTEPPPH